MNYTRLSHAFSEVKNLNVKDVGTKIGGKVEQNINAGIFQNACAIRLSYAINQAGGTISRSDGEVSSGADGKWYLYRVADMEKYIKRISSRKLTGTKLSDFSLQQGVIIFKNCGWSDATGHIDLFDGTKVESHDYSSQCGNIELYIL